MQRTVGTVLVAGIVLVAATARGAVGEDLARLRDEVVRLRLEVLRSQAELQAVRDLDGLLLGSRAERAPQPREVGGADKVWSAVVAELEKSHKARLDALKTLQNDLHDQQELATRKWTEANLDALKFRDTVAATEARLGLSWASQSRAGVWDATMQQIVLWGLVLLTGSLALACHEARGRIRWSLRSLGSRPMAVAGMLALLVLSPGCGTQRNLLEGSDRVARLRAEQERLEQERQELQRRLTELQDRLKAARSELEKDQARLDRTRVASLLPLAPPRDATPAPADTLLDLETDTQNRVLAILAEAHTLHALADDGARVMADLEKERADLAKFEAGGRGRAIATGVSRAVVCVLFMVSAFVTFTSVKRRKRHRLERESAQCPRCLESGGLEIVSSGVRDQNDGDLKYVECQGCTYKFRESYLRLPRLCFPTVGIRSSGKTRWLLTAYDMIRNSNIPVGATISKVPSLGDEEFDELVKKSLERHEDTELTHLGLPAPLTFYHRDRDPLGPSAVMLNMFDFSGEVMFRQLEMDQVRRRALLFDGFVLFLDPTQVLGGGRGLSIMDQNNALLRFKEEMRAVRNVPEGKPIDVPIAVCLSKLDLLVTKNPMGDASRRWIQELRDSMFSPVDLNLIHHRSQECARVLPMMFPGWKLERELRENFGGRLMFFPLTPVGLEEGELGVEDLSRRTFAPFGILEPILWLLHMHGYCVFP